MDFQSNFKEYSFPKLGYIKIPKMDIPIHDIKRLGLSSNCSSEQYLRALMIEGFENKLKSGLIPKEKADIYLNRIELEFDEIVKLLFTDYILLVYNIIRFCKDNSILNSPSRGSCGGSLLLWVIDVVKIDAIKHNLLFERFISAGRTEVKEIDGEKYISSKNVPDVDIDNDRSLKYKVNEFLESQFKGRTASIKTFSTLQGKSIIKEVLKCYEEFSEQEAKEVSDLIQVNFGKVEQINDALSNNPKKENIKFKEWAKNYKDAVIIAQKLNGLIKGSSVHASGIILCNDKLEDCLPLELSMSSEENAKVIVSAFDMEGAQNLGIKVDNLGLKNLEAIKECLDLIGKKLEDIDVNHPSIYNYLNNSNYYKGIFQAEDGLGKSVLQKIKPTNIEDISLSVAIGRPGSYKFLNEIIDAKFNNNIRQIDVRVQDILNDTFNVIVYQEQIMALSKRMADFSSQEADGIRKCVSGDTTFVSKTRGIISINSLLINGYKNDLFLVMDDCGRQFWKPIQNIWKSGNKLVKKITARNGLNIKTTGEHQFLTNDWWKSRVNLLTNKDYLVCAKEISYIGEDRISSDMAIIIAGLLTEGYFTEKGATFTNYNKFVMDIFCESFFKVFGKYPKLGYNGRVARIDKESRLQISKYLSYGKSAVKLIPEIMMGMTKETTRKFLSFMLTCEGGCIEQGKFEISSKSIQMINQIKLLLLRFGIRSCFYHKDNHKYGRFYYINIGEKSQLLKLINELSILMEPHKIDKLNLYINRTIGMSTLDIIPNNITQKFIKQYGIGENVDASGSLYKSTISRDKFCNLVYWTKDQHWLDIANGKQEYSKVKSILRTYPDMEEVYDFTIDNETPFILANGIVIHNCIGKKLTDKMPEYKESFIKGCLKNGYEKEFISWIWTSFEDSGSYLFNRSHACGYSYLTAICAYLKANHPTEFFYTLLKNAKNESKPLEEITSIVEELIHFGIELLPPSLLLSDIDFKIEGERKIRMGLGDIKGVSRKSLDKLKNFKSVHSNKLELFQSAGECGLNVGVMSALIQAGAMDEFFHKSRARMVLELQLYRLLTPREKAKVMSLGSAYNYDLYEIVLFLTGQTNPNKDIPPFIKEKRLKTIREKYDKYKKIFVQNSKNEELANYFYERKLLGFSYSQDIYKILLKEHKDIVKISEIESEVSDPKQKYTFGGEIVEVIYGTARNAKKTKYVKLKIQDKSGAITSMMFNDRIENAELYNKGKFEPGQIVVCNGRKVSDDAIFCDEIARQEAKIMMNLSDLKDADND